MRAEVYGCHQWRIQTFRSEVGGGGGGGGNWGGHSDPEVTGVAWSH